MHESINNLISIREEIQSKIKDSKELIKDPKIIAVSKTFSMSHISPLINQGHIDFGENKVQEAIDKWTDIKNDFSHIKLHMIGKLQSNKVKYVIPLFDYVHSLDNLKLAEKIAQEQSKRNKRLKIFIQVNIGNEDQKNGVNIESLNNFYRKCVDELDLDIIGLMCLPPNNENVSKYFIEMKSLSEQLQLNELSMGMSQDYLTAAENGSTFLRIGSKIFGIRVS